MGLINLKDYKIGICYFSTKHAVSKSKSRDWLAGNQDNVAETGWLGIRIMCQRGSRDWLAGNQDNVSEGAETQVGWESG